MIFKVTYQENALQSPRRESTKSLYIEAASKVEARKMIEQHTAYNIEFIQELNEAHLAYEQKNPDFTLVTF